jgi:hypothetical protein
VDLEADLNKLRPLKRKTIFSRFLPTLLLPSHILEKRGLAPEPIPLLHWAATRQNVFRPLACQRATATEAFTHSLAFRVERETLQFCQKTMAFRALPVPSTGERQNLCRQKSPN